MAPLPVAERPAAASVPADEAALEAIASASAHGAFLADARALPPESVEEYHLDPVLVCANVQHGLENVLSREEALGDAPAFDHEALQALPALAQALAFAELQLRREARAAGVAQPFASAVRIRRRLRRVIEALLDAELLPIEEVGDLLRRRDYIEDGPALAALLRRNMARLAGRVPLAPASLDEADDIAATLRERLALRDDGERGALLDAAEVRDRLATLVTARHERLWRAGAWIFGRAVDDFVPPLGAPPVVVRRGVESPAPDLERRAADIARRVARMQAEKERIRITRAPLPRS